MRKFLILLVVLGLSNIIFAQTEVSVKGNVLNSAGEPMNGVTVNVKGTQRTTFTKPDGSFEIATASNAVLVFSYIGYETFEQAVGTSTDITVTLKEEDKSLNEVVVVGYGTQKRKDLTGAISSLSGSEMAKVPVQNVGQALQGRLAGVQVTMGDGTPGSEPSIKIRGGTSITQSNEPLYVVDGVPQTEGLNFLDPMDIESVDVLKDASATAIYGARGANGVILITTKQIKPGKVTVNYDGYVGAKKITNEISVMNPYEYVMLMYERADTDPEIQKFDYFYGSYDSIKLRYENQPGINWQRKIFGETALNQYHKVSINGGSKETKFNIFYSRNNDEGIMMNSGSLKNIAKLTLNHKIGNKFTVNAIVNYSNQKISGLGTQEGGNARLSMLQTLLQYRPTTGLIGSEEDLAEAEIDPLDPNPSSPAFQSPLIKIRSQHRERVIKALNANATIQYNINKQLTYRGLVSYTDNSDKRKEFNDATSLFAIRSGGATGQIIHNIGSRFNYNNTLSYSKTFNKQHRLDATVGQEYIYNYTEGLGAGATGFPVANLGWDDLSLGAIAGFPSSFAEDDKLLSFFGRVNYGFDDRYLLTATLRRDGSSKFGEENVWGTFPSVALAWRVINEDFMKSSALFSDFKLRLSYGQAGNNRIANYAALGIFTSGVYPLNNSVVPTAYQDNLPNPSLKWEASEATNIGLDLGFLKQRITLTTELYDNRSKDLLFNVRIPASAGFTTQFQNIGTTSSRGIEFTLNTINIRNKDFSWNTNFNIGFNRTKVLSLSDDETSMVTNSYTTTNDFILEVGQPVGIMYGYVRDGLYQVDDFNYDATSGYTLKNGVVRDNITVQPGYIKFKDISGPDGVPDGVINDLDRTRIGNANPKYSGGINNNFSYKGFDLSVFLNFTVGNDIYNANVLNNARLDLDYQNTLSIFNDRWVTIDPATGARVTDPAQLISLNAGKTQPHYQGNATGRLYNDIIEDGSFLRLNNISFGYTLPKTFVNKAKISNARIYFTAYNLHVFTKYSGYDPEVSVIRTALTPGVDFSAYPRAKSFVAGLNISL